MRQPTVLLTLGRLPPAVDVARSFARAGWRVVVAEPFPRHMAGTSNAVAASHRVPAPVDDPDGYRQALLELIDREAVSLVVPISEETMHVSALHDELAALPEPPTLFCPTQPDILRLHSKHDFARTAADAGLGAPETTRLGTDAAHELVARHDVVIKPEFSCSGRGVQFVEQGQPLPDADDAFVVQARCSGQELCGFAIAQAGRICVSSIYRGAIRDGSSSIAFERNEHAGIETWMRQFVAHVDHTGLIAFDFFVDGDTVQAVECNPRATSGLHFVRMPEIAPVITGDAASASLREERLLQEFWSTWTHWFRHLRDGDERRATGRVLRRARDVTWRRDDPRVFLLATWSTWPMISQALARGETFAEVLALDIEYRAPGVATA